MALRKDVVASLLKNATASDASAVFSAICVPDGTLVTVQVTDKEGEKSIFDAVAHYIQDVTDTIKREEMERTGTFTEGNPALVMHKAMVASLVHRAAISTFSEQDTIPFNNSGKKSNSPIAIVPSGDAVGDCIADFWADNLVRDNHCSLCGNYGVLDTRGVRTAMGVEVGRLNYCICPNGMALREAGADLSQMDTRE